MVDSMTIYGMVFAKLAIGLLAIILQINLMGKGNLAPTSALDQLQNYVLGGIIGEVEKQGYSIKQVYVAEYTDGYVDIYPFRQTKGFSFHKKSK